MKLDTVTLAEVCEKLIKYNLYDFSEPLQVCYRTIELDNRDGLFGYCVISKDQDKFIFEHIDNEKYFDDGDIYSMFDDLIMWQFNKNIDNGRPMLSVWMLIYD